MIYGFWAFWRLGGAAQVLSTLLFIPSMLNALSSILTIGDNRFRIPTMSLSLILQLFGGYALLASRRVYKWTQKKPETTWVGLNWKKNSEKDSLRA
jgi:hypothetical protein